MRRFRKHLLTAAFAVALLLPLGGIALADPIDGGFSDPTIVTPAITVRITAPGTVTITPTNTAGATTAADPVDGGF